MERYFLSGNYGNKLDQSVPPSSSTTPPTNAVYDGCYYYYLPWGDTKPCVCVDSHWEDISFRLDNLNILTRLCERLVSIMNQSRVIMLCAWLFYSKWFELQREGKNGFSGANV